MKYGKTVLIDPTHTFISFEEQMTEAVGLICKELMNSPVKRGFKRNMETFQISCRFFGEGEMLTVYGTIEDTPCGYTREDMIDGMTEALMDWDKERGRGGDTIKYYLKGVEQK